jgi:hypothetical protein
MRVISADKDQCALVMSGNRAQVRLQENVLLVEQQTQA